MTTKCGCGGVRGLPVTADIGKQPGRARPAPTGVARQKLQQKNRAKHQAGSIIYSM